MRLLLGLVVAALVTPLAGHAEGACRAESGAKVVPLVELYTSEGCSSCPAADRWLSTHFPPDARADAVALAFHVDYWDRLGWRDRFAMPAFTERQYEVMRANRATFVYTPQVVVQGRDYPGWRRGAPALGTAAKREPRARIAVQAASDGDALDVQASVEIEDAPRRDVVLTIAYADSRLVSEVKAGENRGVTLTHDHVVRAMLTRPLSAAATTWKLSLKKPTEAGTHPKVVAFVQDLATGDVLQTLALSLGDCR